MLKSIGAFIAYMWCILFISGNGFVMAVSFAVIFILILIHNVLDDSNRL